MKKVLFTASTHGHILNFHLPYLSRFSHCGWEVHVACAGAVCEVSGADEVIALPLEKKMSAPGNFKAAALLRKRIRRERYDLIVTHTTLAAFFARLALWGMKERPRVVNVVHGYLFDDDTPALKKAVLLTAERLVAGQTDLLLTMNRWDFAQAKAKKLGNRVDFIPGIGVDFSGKHWGDGEDRAALRGEFGIAPDAFVLMYAAEFSKRKSQDVLIRAMAQLPESVVLVLPGQGALWEQCRVLAQELGVGRRVIFPGYISDMGRWYAMADAAVSASRSEGLPFNIMEAMYAGLPVVASAVKGHTDLIREGETGLLYPYGDASACAQQIGRMMQSEPLRTALARQAKENVAQYDLHRVLPVVMAQYQSLWEDGASVDVPANSISR